MLDVAVIGTGYIGAVHLETLLRVPGVRIVALADVNVALAEKLARRYGIERVTADWRALVDDPSISVVHTCTPNHLHFEINKSALEAGKHVLSEKPLAISACEARELRDLAAACEQVTGINFCYRYYPVVQEAAVRVRRGDIGRVHSVFGAYFQDWLLYDSDYSWRLSRDYAGPSNTMADIGSHWLDLAQYVSGARITEVMADLRTITPVRKRSKTDVLTFATGTPSDYDEVPIDVDDSGSVLVRFDNGAAGTFMVGQLCAGRKCTIDLQIYGTTASFAWNHERSAELWIGHRDRANERLVEGLMQSRSTAHYARLPSGHPLGYYDAVYNLFADFYREVASDPPEESPAVARPTFATGYEETLLIEAILESHTTGRWVDISL